MSRVETAWAAYVVEVRKAARLRSDPGATEQQQAFQRNSSAAAYQAFRSAFDDVIAAAAARPRCPIQAQLDWWRNEADRLMNDRPRPSSAEWRGWLERWEEAQGHLKRLSVEGRNVIPLPPRPKVPHLRLVQMEDQNAL